MRVLKGNSLYRWFLGLSLALTPAQADTVPGSPTFYLAGNGGADRCVTSDCMCRVRPGLRPQDPQTIEETERRYSAYFPPSYDFMCPSASPLIKGDLNLLHILLLTTTAYN